MALNFSHKRNKDLKQNCPESRQSSTARGSRISWAEHLPDPGLLPGSLASMNTHSRSEIQGSFTAHCMGSGWGGAELPGRLLDPTNNTPISPCEGRENSLDFSYRRKELASTHLMNGTVAIF